MRKEVQQLHSGEIKDDSSYVYALPFEKGKSFRVIQGYFSQFTHKERIALDFNMKRGTRVAAARDGIVMRMKKDGDRGGLKNKYRPYGNYVVIQHADGTRSGYWHLEKDSVFVHVGDTVKRGEVIALSGKTGYALIPHLHFIVWQSDKNGWKQIPTRFQTSQGPEYLRFWGKYKNN